MWYNVDLLLLLLLCLISTYSIREILVLLNSLWYYLYYELDFGIIYYYLRILLFILAILSLILGGYELDLFEFGPRINYCDDGSRGGADAGPGPGAASDPGPGPGPEAAPLVETNEQKFQRWTTMLRENPQQGYLNMLAEIRNKADTTPPNPPRRSSE